MNMRLGELLRITLRGQATARLSARWLKACRLDLWLTKLVQQAMNLRKTGGTYSKRKEDDRVEWRSGVVDGLTTGEPIEVHIANQDARSSDYSFLPDHPPGSSRPRDDETNQGRGRPARGRHLKRPHDRPAGGRSSRSTGLARKPRHRCRGPSWCRWEHRGQPRRNNVRPDGRTKRVKARDAETPRLPKRWPNSSRPLGASVIPSVHGWT